MMNHQVMLGDCLSTVRSMEPGSVNLVFTSPPYEAQRTYGIDFKLRGDDWVQWAADRFEACYAASSGLTAWVVAGSTRQFRWSATPALLVAELHRRGVRLRNPPIYHRVGIPGSGGPDWLRSDYEWVVCASGGRLPWSDPTAMGHEPKYAPGGAPSHRMPNGRRVHKLHTKHDGKAMRVQGYNPPAKANPGNVVRVSVGGGQLGSKLAHENEAPFPEKLAEFFIRSFCPPGGLVLDPFCGSGTTAAVAKRLGRRSLSIDVRESQVELTQRRLAEAGGQG